MRIVVAFGTAETSLVWVESLRRELGCGFEICPWYAGQAEVHCEVAVVWRPGAEFFILHPGLKWVFAAGAGVDSLLAEKLPQQIRIVRLQDAGMGQQMADYVSYGVLRFMRQFDVYEREAPAWSVRPPQRKADWPVGILGYGTLAQPVAKTLGALGFSVQAWARSHKPGASISVHVGAKGWAEFLRSSRVLVAMLPLTAQTHHIVCAQSLALLPKGAFLINVARGGLVNQNDLLAALESGQLQGALLDVTTPEPLPPEHPLWGHPKVCITPHVAAATLPREAAAQIATKIALLWA